MIHLFQLNINGMISLKNILLVEDDRLLCDGVALSLQNKSINITKTYSLKDAKIQLDQTGFDLIILDINLPDGNGLDFLKQIRNTLSTPVILLTANDLEMYIVNGLEAGANDYITKPFSLAVLRARVNNQLRSISVPTIKKIDHFTFDFNKMEFYRHNEKIDLSKTEQKLLKILVDNLDITLSKEKIMDKLWADETDYIDTNTLSVIIKRLRDKLEHNPSNPEYIHNIYGIGYVWRSK